MLLAMISAGCTMLSPTTINRTPPASPWETLAPMDRSLGRFSLATDGHYIYRCGGIDYNIRSGGSYGRSFAHYDIQKNTWAELKPIPLGTGGACYALRAPDGPLLAIAGIDCLGDQFNTNGVTLGAYEITKGEWSVREIACVGLGRPDQLIHWQGAKFLLLTASKSLDHGENVAVLDTDRASIDILGRMPTINRIVGCAMIGGALVVLEAGRPATLQVFHPKARQWDTPRVIQGLATEYFDLVFAYRGELLLLSRWHPDWKTAIRYEYNYKLYCIDPDSGIFRELHPEFANPQARRSCAGICVGNLFYLLGGQRQDDVWLSEMQRYHFLLRDPYYHVISQQAHSARDNHNHQ